MYLISKILLNSLYGRFGMNPFLGETRFITKEDYNKNLEAGLIKFTDCETEEDFNNHLLLKYNNLDMFGLQAFLPIAMAITAYSRIKMSHVKNNPNLTLLYSDTDSIISYEALDSSIVDETLLGMWKLEDEYLFGIFLGPKLYGCMNTNLKKLFKDQRL